MSEPIKRAAVLGTGIIGAPIARNLAAAGIETSAWNRSADKAEPLAADGVTVAATAAEAVADADAILTVLTDADSVTEVMDDGGVLAAAGDGAIWIQMSTVGAEPTERLASLAADAGLPFIDAPVLGTKKPAEDGNLIVLASGAPAAIERCRPIFDAIGSRTVELGDEPGGGSRMKLVLNGWLLSLTAGLAQALNLAEALDVDPEQFLSVIEGGPIDVAYAHMKGALMISRDYETSFSLANAAKDAGLVVAAAEAHGTELALAETIRELFDEALAQGLGEQDMAAVHEVGSRQADERPAAAS
jgi:3-hydroxyisobutyrate dehydrogenase